GRQVCLGGVLRSSFAIVAKPFAPIKNPVSTSAGGRKAGRGKPEAHTASLAISLTWLQAGRPKDHGMVRGLPLAPLGVKGGLRHLRQFCRFRIFWINLNNQRENSTWRETELNESCVG